VILYRILKVKIKLWKQKLCLHAFYSHHARKFTIVSPLELLIRQTSSLFLFKFLSQG